MTATQNYLKVLGFGLVSSLGNKSSQELNPDKSTNKNTGKNTIDKINQYIESLQQKADTNNNLAATFAPLELAELANFVDKKELRRIPYLGRMGLLASYLALQDAGLEQLFIDQDNTKILDEFALVTASNFGPVQTALSFLNSLEDFGQELVSPTAFSTSLQHSLCSTISMQLKLQCPCISVSQGMHSLYSGLESSASILNLGLVKTVLLVIAESNSPELYTVLNQSFGEQTMQSCEGALALVLSLDEPNQLPNQLGEMQNTNGNKKSIAAISTPIFSSLDSSTTATQSFVCRKKQVNIVDYLTHNNKHNNADKSIVSNADLGLKVFAHASSFLSSLLTVKCILETQQSKEEHSGQLENAAWVCVDDYIGVRACFEII